MPSKDRQRVLARAKLERQMARRAAAARRRRQMQAAIGAVVALVAVIGGTAFLVTKFDGDKKSDADTAAPQDPTPSAEPTPTPAASLAPGECAYQKSSGGQVKDVGLPPTKSVPHTGTRTATIQLGQGAIEVTLDLAKTPCTANSFAFLAGKKYFDGSTCHRMTDAGIFVLQCGDPFGKGTGGPGYQFGVENLPKAGGANPYPAGTLAMANSGSPDSNGSQFFIVYKDGSQLGPDYTPFGTVTKGLDIVTAIGKVGHDGSFDPQPGGGKPKQPVKLEKVTVSAPKT